MRLAHFTANEFGSWWPRMDEELLLKLDAFRAMWGDIVRISPVPGAIGREDDSNSYHNVRKHGRVKAVDVFPMRKGRYLHRETDRFRMLTVAKQAGFTGIGIYTDTAPGNMLHLDVRPGVVATWSRVAGEYKSIDEVLS